MTRARATITIVIVLMAIAAVAKSVERAPEAMVERVVTVENRMTRLSLFSNRVVVVRITEDGDEVFSNRIELEEEAFVVYVGAVSRDAETISDMHFIPSVFEDAPQGILRLQISDRGLVEVRYPRSALVELPMARLCAALDDLEILVKTASFSSNELREWEPETGDVVELMSGERARVIEVAPEGLLRLEHLDVSIVELVPLDSRTRVIRRVVETPE